MTSIGPSASIAMTLGEPVESLSQRAQAADATQRQQIATDFESVFLSTLLKQMRQSVDGDGLFAGDSSDTYGGMFDLFMGKHLAANGGLGIRDMILKYLESSKT